MKFSTWNEIRNNYLRVNGSLKSAGQELIKEMRDLQEKFPEIQEIECNDFTASGSRIFLIPIENYKISLDFIIQIIVPQNGPSTILYINNVRRFKNRVSRLFLPKIKRKQSKSLLQGTKS